MSQETDPIEAMRYVVQLADATVASSLARAGFHNLTRSQWVVLLLLDQGRTTPGSLRQSLGVTQQFVSKCLKVLSDEGCVELATVDYDKRRRGLALTQRGQRAVALVKARRTRMLSAAAANLGEDSARFLQALQEQSREEHPVGRDEHLANV